MNLFKTKVLRLIKMFTRYRENRKRITYSETFDMTDPCAISVFMNPTELEMRPGGGGFLVNEETRTIKSIRESINNGSETSSKTIDLNGSVNRESDENSSNVISSKTIPIILATLLIDYCKESVDVPNTNNFVSNFHTNPEPIFSPSASLFDQNEESTG